MKAGAGERMGEGDITPGNWNIDIEPGPREVTEDINK